MHYAYKFWMNFSSLGSAIQTEFSIVNDFQMKIIAKLSLLTLCHTHSIRNYTIISITLRLKLLSALSQ